MSKVLITGVAGFLGSQIASDFCSAGWEVVGADSSSEENAPTNICSQYLSTRLPSVEFDELVVRAQPSLLIHCAGRASVGLSVSNPKADFEGNSLLTFRLLDCLRLNVPHCRFILLSSAAVYGNPHILPINETAAISPISPYGFHKRMAELICEEFATVFGMRTCSVRIFSAYGAGLKRQVIWDLSRKMFQSGDLCLRGTGDESRDFIHVRDVAKALVLLANRAPMRGEQFNLASGIETKISDLARILLEVSAIDKKLAFDGQRPEGTPTRWRADISRIRDLGFEPEWTIEHGVRDFATWAAPLLRN